MAITGSTRRQASFVIYKDEPQPPSTRKSKASSSTSRNGSRASTSSDSDKENLNPLTGRRPVVEDNLLKKRKTNVLATKLIAITRKAVLEPDSPKKRKVFTSFDGPATKKDKKEKRVGSINPRKQRSNYVRKAINMPKLDEVVEEEGDEEPREGVLAESVQTSATAKSHELTVLPVADFAAGFGESCAKVLSSKREATLASKFEDPLHIVHHRRSSSNYDRETDAVSASPAPSQRIMTIFNTPERKRIYSAFTFESPSPASERFASWKECGVERFPKIDFNPEIHLTP